MPVFYHYTDKTGFEGIMSSGVIKQSHQLDAGDDAAFGSGVYLTTVPPTASKEQIIRECWGPNAVNTMLKSGRVDYVIWIDLPDGLAQPAATKRKVFLHVGDLHLKKYNYDGRRV